MFPAQREVNAQRSSVGWEHKPGDVTTCYCHQHLRALPQDFISGIIIPWSFCVLLFPNQKEQNCAHKTDNSQSNEDSSAIALCGKTNKSHDQMCRRDSNQSSYLQTTNTDMLQCLTQTNFLAYLPHGAAGKLLCQFYGANKISAN